MRIIALIFVVLALVAYLMGIDVPNEVSRGGDRIYWGLYFARQEASWFMTSVICCLMSIATSCYANRR